MQARYYDPVIGRFYSNDPVDAISHLNTPNGIHGFNRYTYANNNPYKYTDPTGMSSYGAQQMSVTMAPSKSAAKANHASYTSPRSGADTTKIVAGAAVIMTGSVVPGVIMMGEGLTGGSLSKEVALAGGEVGGVTKEIAETAAVIYDVADGVKSFGKNIGKIMDNFGPDTVSGMAKGGVDLTAEAAVLVNDGDQATEILSKPNEN